MDLAALAAPAGFRGDGLPVGVTLTLAGCGALAVAVCSPDISAL